ncbi:MAG: hypothetical protein V4541_02665 [Bacteroidota bacterium]
MNLSNRNINPALAQQILAEHGTMISLEEAEALLKVMYDFSEILVAQVKRERESAVSKIKRKPRNL